jgi:spore coat protein A
MSIENITVVPLLVSPELIPQPAALDPKDLQPYQGHLPTPPVCDLTAVRDHAQLRIVLRNKLVEIHPQLTRTTPVWSYDVYDDATGKWLAPECYLGPTIVVRRKQHLEMTYVNELHGFLPFRALVTTLQNKVNPDIDPLTANLPGDQISGGPSPTAAIGFVPGSAELYAWAVTHLHGGRTAAIYDGWTENAMLPPRTEDQAGKINLPGGSQVSIYENAQRATMLWYHDHGMGITRLNVVAGLAGAYLIRDPDEEKGLAASKVFLPAGEREIPLIIQDRNLDTDTNGKLTGRLLHKSSAVPNPMDPNAAPSTAEYFAPYTMVNGVIWPNKKIARARCRLRLLNGSNARTYCLKAVGVDAQGKKSVLLLNDFVRQIGSDGGLLAQPVKVPDNTPPQPLPGSPAPSDMPPATDGLILAPAERADLYVDFGRVPAGIRYVEIVNVAFAPFHRNTIDHPNGEPLPNNTPAPAGAPGDAQPLLRVPFPQVMRFELGDPPPDQEATDLIGAPVPPQLADPQDFLPNFLAELQQSQDPPKPRLVILVEDPGGMLMMFEMAKNTADVQTAFNPVFNAPINMVDTDGNATTYVPIATRFEDRVAIFPRYGRWDVWQILNLSADTHPFHVHLVQFRALQRQPATINPAGTWTPFSNPGQVPIETLESPLQVDANEQGWKDTIRVNPGEMLTFAARFEGFTGRYMYHCHILEHEDHEMMRPFVVIPEAAMNLMPDMPMLDGTDLMKMDSM